MSLPRLYTAFYDQPVFRFDEARQRLKIKAPALSVMLHDLQRQEYILKIKNGLYAIKPLERKGKNFSPNKYLVAAELQRKLYLSYHTALELHGVAQSLYNTVYVSVPRQSKSLQFQENDYQFITTFHSFGVEEINVENVPILVTDREKTVIDGLAKLKYVGGLDEYLKSVSSFPSVDSVKLLRYLSLINKKVLYAKTGWLISRFLKQWSVNESVLSKLRKQLSERTFYLEETSGKANYRFNEQWNLMIPANLESKLEETPR